VLYNVPGRTGCDMLPETVAQLARTPRIVGIKEASGSITRGQQIIAATPPEFVVLSGDDALALALTTVGGRGVVSVLSNLVPAATARMIRLGREGRLDEARKIHYRLLPLMEALFVESNPIPAKAAVALMGYSANEVRLPLVPLAGERIERLRAVMAQEGVFK